VHVERTVWHLELSTPDGLRPSRSVDGLRLDHVTEPQEAVDRLVEVHDRIAAAHHWSSLGWSRERWSDELARPHQDLAFITAGDEPIGLAWWRSETDGGVQLVMFGLVPEATGRGLGGPALTAVVRSVWSSLARGSLHEGTGEGCGGRRRLWLRTSTLDHPHALGNYLARGFVITDRVRDVKHLEQPPPGHRMRAR
jgi:hypothetical protein